MNAVRSFASLHPVWFVWIVMIAWFVLAMVLMGLLAGAFHKHYGEPVTLIGSRLLVTAGMLVLIWRLGWLHEAGIARLGSWQAWLLALGSLAYFAAASLYAMYGTPAPDLSGALKQPGASAATLLHFSAALSEEIVFRGLILYALARVWGGSTAGIIASAGLTSLMFAGLHITQVFMQGVSPVAALYLTLESAVVSLWWAALVIGGGSIWPVVLIHFVGNTVVALRGLSTRLAVPEITAYRQLFWLSLPLGILALILLGLNLTRPGWSATVDHGSSSPSIH